MATLPWTGEDEGTGGRPVRIRPKKTKRKPKPVAATGPKTPPSEYDIAVKRAKAAESMKSALTQMDFPAGGEKGIAGAEANLGFLMDPSQYPGGFTSPEFTGSSGVGPAGLSIVAGQGVARLLSKKMVKDIPKGGPAKGIGDIPKSLTANMDARSRKLFGKDPKNLNKYEAQGLFTDVVDKKNYAPVAGVRAERAAVGTEARAKTAAATQATARREEGAGITATLKADKRAAEAAGTPAIVVSERTSRTGAPRAVRSEESGIKGVQAKVAGKEGREAGVAAKGQVARQTEPRPPAPSMAGETLTEKQVAGVGRKARTRVSKKATSKANKAVRGIRNASDEVDATVDPSAAKKQLKELQAQLDELEGTASPEAFKAAKGVLAKLKNRISNTVGATVATANRGKVQQAAERRAAAQAATPANAKIAQKSWDEFLKLDQVQQKALGVQAAKLAKKPWGEMNGAERRRWVHEVWTTPQAGRLPRHATPQQRDVIARRYERVHSKAKKSPAEDRAARHVAAAKKKIAARKAPRVAEEAAGAEKAATIGPIGAVERGARQVAFGGPKAVGAGVRETKKLVGKAWRGELPKNVPIGTGVLAAAGGTAYAVKDHQLESDEEAMNEATQARLDAKGISVPKALGRKKVKDDLKVAAKKHDKVGWYKDKVEDWPKNWLTLYNKLHEWGGWQTRGKYLDYLQDLNKSPAQGRAFAAKDFPRVVQNLINRKIITPEFLITSYGDNDIAVDFDLEALGSTLNKKAAK